MISVKNKSVTSTYVTEAADKANTSFSNMWPVEIEDKEILKYGGHIWPYTL